MDRANQRPAGDAAALSYAALSPPPSRGNESTLFFADPRARCRSARDGPEQQSTKRVAVSVLLIYSDSEQRNKLAVSAPPRTVRFLFCDHLGLKTGTFIHFYFKFFLKKGSNPLE